MRRRARVQAGLVPLAGTLAASRRHSPPAPLAALPPRGHGMLAPPVLCCAVLLRARGPALWPSLCAARPRRGAVQGCDVGSDQGDHHEAHLLLGGRRLLLAARRRRGAHELAAGAPPHARGARGPRGVPRLPAGAEAVPVGRGRGAWRLLPRALPGAP